MTKVFTHEFVFNKIAKTGYVLISSYKNSRAEMLVLCPMGHEFSVTWNSFTDTPSRKGSRCPICAILNRALAHDHVFNEVAKTGYALISHYKNAKTEMMIRCSIGHLFSVSWAAFKDSPSQKGSRCPICFAGTRLGQNIRKGKALFTMKQTIAKQTRHPFGEYRFHSEEDLIPIAAKIEKFYQDTPSGKTVDHRIPRDWFDLEEIDAIAVCESLDNLQYLTPSENAAKKNKMTNEYFLEAMLINVDTLSMAAYNMPKKWKTLLDICVKTFSLESVEV